MFLLNDKFSIPDMVFSVGLGSSLRKSLEGTKNVSKYCWLLPSLPRGEPGNFVIVTDSIAPKGFPALGHTATFSLMESLEHLKMINSFTHFMISPFFPSLKVFKCNLK